VLGATKDSDLFEGFNKTHEICDRTVKVTCSDQLDDDSKLGALLGNSSELSKHSAFLIFLPKDKPADAIKEYVRKFIDKIRGKDD